MRDIADEVGITERAAHRIVNELVDGGYLSKHRVGRQNSYEVHPDAPPTHPFATHCIGTMPWGSSWSYCWEKVKAGWAEEWPAGSEACHCRSGCGLAVVDAFP